jgi:diacylglycerol kinase family enzyme
LAGFLIVNPRSGDESGTDDLLEAAAARGVRVHVFRPGESLTEVARTAAEGPIGVAGGDGSLAPVAEVAVELGVPFVCVPFGTRNHFARDLGLERDDPAAALDAFVDGVEERIDVGRANERLFLNNVSLGVYARLVHRREQHRRRRDVFARLRALAIVAQHPQPLGITIDGTPLEARVVLVANNSYSLHMLSLGARERLDEGKLHLYAPAGLFRDAWEERKAPGFVVDARRGRLEAAVDGEPDVLATPIEFRVDPSALRVLVPREQVRSAEPTEEDRMDNPEATEREQEEVGTDRHQDEEDMRGPAEQQETPTEEGADE